MRDIPTNLRGPYRLPWRAAGSSLCRSDFANTESPNRSIPFSDSNAYAILVLGVVSISPPVTGSVRPLFVAR